MGRNVEEKEAQKNEKPKNEEKASGIGNNGRVEINREKKEREAEMDGKGEKKDLFVSVLYRVSLHKSSRKNCRRKRGMQIRIREYKRKIE